MKKYIVIISAFITILISIFLSIFFVNKNNIIQMIDKNIKGEIQKDITHEYCGWKDDKAEVLVSFTDPEDGISRIETPDGRIIEFTRRNKIAIDYVMELNTPYIFKMYNENGEIFEKEIILSMNIIIYKQDEGYGYKKVAINYINPTTESYTKQYKIGQNGTWTTYSEAFYLWDYDLTYQNLVDEDNTITIYGKLVSQNGTIYEEGFKINVNTDIVAKVDELEADSLIEAVQSEEYSIGMFNIKVKDETYVVHAYEFDKSQNFNINTVFGIADDVATANSYAKRMVIIKVNGDLTIEQNKTLTSYRNLYGGTKGLFIYATGSVTNNGTITMSARGAKAVGQNIYLWKNEDESYEYVPATGTAGGAGGRANGSQYSGATGGTPAAATNRATGGGGRWCWTI